MKQAYLELLEEVVEEFGEKITVDEDLLGRLRLAKVITKSELEKIKAKETTAVRLLLLFEGILPLKEDSKMDALQFVLREAGNEVVSRFLAGKIIEINDTPGTSQNSAIPMYRSEMEELGRRIRKFFFGQNFTTIKIMTSDDIFQIQDMWVNLEMKRPKGIQWSPVADYESSLTESLLENIPVIVRGEPGIGKSTLVKKICYDWAERSEKEESTGFGKFHLVLPCRLREAGPAKTIPEMVLQWLKNSIPALRPTIETLSENLDKLFESYRILFVLDGWDEDLGNCDELKNLLNFPREFDYFLLITTRPREMKPRDSRFGFYQIVGFNHWDKIKFIDKFSRLVGKKAENLKEELQAKPHLSEMARIPLLLVSICTVEAASSARNTTELFMIVVRFILDRHAEKGRAESGSEFPEDWQDDPRVCELGKLALEGLLQKEPEHQLVFKECNLKNRISPEILEIGLLCRENHHKLQQASYNVSFPHKTFQEFFAALFIRSRFGKQESLSESLKTETIGKEHWGRLLEKTTAFLIGLTQVGESGKLSKTLDGNRLLSSLVSDIGLEFNSQNPILRECKDEKTALTICRMAVKMYAEDHERLAFWADLTGKDFQFLLRSIGGMHIDSIAATINKAMPCFSFLSNAGHTTETSDPTDGSSDLYKVSCNKLLIWSEDQDRQGEAKPGPEALKLIGCFKSLQSLKFCADSKSLTPLDSIMIINRCPGDVKVIDFVKAHHKGFPIFEPSPSPDSLLSTAASHPDLKDLGFEDLPENCLEPILILAAAFPALTDLRIGFCDRPSTEAIRGKLIQSLRRFKSLQFLRVKSRRDEDNLIKEVDAGIREAGMDISLGIFY